MHTPLYFYIYFYHPKLQMLLVCKCDPQSKTISHVFIKTTTRGWMLEATSFSQRHYPAEEKYSAYDRELAIYKALIEGRRFYIFTDHKPLVTMFVNNKQSYTRRQLRHMDYIRQFTTDIRHVKGTDNIIICCGLPFHRPRRHRCRTAVPQGKPFVGNEEGDTTRQWKLSLR